MAAGGSSKTFYGAVQPQNRSFRSSGCQISTPKAAKSRTQHSARRPSLQASYGPGDFIQIPSHSRSQAQFESHEYDLSDIDDPDENVNLSLNSSGFYDHFEERGREKELSFNETLLQMLKTQSEKLDKLTEKQDKLEEGQVTLKKELQSLKDDAESTPKRKGKRIVKRVLTDRVNILYDSMEKKYKADERIDSKDNKEVFQQMSDELLKDPDNTDAKKTLSLALRRKYQSERRFPDDKKADRVKKAKYDRRKQRIYDRRKSVITDKEKKFYDMLNKDYMTEESDSEERGVLVVHKLDWRSKKVDKWMEELDRRYKAKLSKKQTSTPSKDRNIGLPSSSTPPNDAPQWAVDPEWTCEDDTEQTNEDASDNQADDVEHEFTP